MPTEGRDKRLETRRLARSICRVELDDATLFRCTARRSGTRLQVVPPVRPHPGTFTLRRICNTVFPSATTILFRKVSLNYTSKHAADLSPNPPQQCTCQPSSSQPSPPPSQQQQHHHHHQKTTAQPTTTPPPKTQKTSTSSPQPPQPNPKETPPSSPPPA